MQVQKLWLQEKRPQLVSAGSAQTLWKICFDHGNINVIFEWLLFLRSLK